MRLLDDADRVHVMVDLEALGDPPNGAIVAVGACKFHLFGDGALDTFYATIRPESCEQFGLHFNGANVRFWLQQPPEAIAALFQPSQRSLLDVLVDFREWYRGSVACWSHVTFDGRLLDDAYRAIKKTLPYSKRDHRDLRTIFDLAYGYGRQPKPVLDGQIPHHALWDATRQVLQVQAAMHVLRKERIDGNG